MPRPRGSKNKKVVPDIPYLPPPPPPETKEAIEEPKSEPKQLPETVSAFEAADLLNTTESTIKMWVDHGHLTGKNGRISVNSIRECRFNTQRRFA